MTSVLWLVFWFNAIAELFLAVCDFIANYILTMSICHVLCAMTVTIGVGIGSPEPCFFSSGFHKKLFKYSIHGNMVHRECVGWSPVHPGGRYRGSYA